ncbi:hypothetical protein MTO96_032334 [Rhipicephalus appendiculatus]
MILNETEEPLYLIEEQDDEDLFDLEAVPGVIRVPIPAELSDEDDEDKLGSAILACIMCILLSLVVAFLLFDVYITDLSGLLCHSHADGFLEAVIPSSCDFVMVDVPLSQPQRHPLYPYMTIINFNPAGLEGHILQHMKTAQDTPLLLVVQRSLLHTSAFSPQAVIRGVFQKVVDIKGHGVVLSDHEIWDSDTTDIMEDAQTLSDEVESYHGLIRYDVFSGNRSALSALMVDVARKSSVTFVYRISGISRTFTHLYFDNFYSKRMDEENLSSVIDRDLIQPMRLQVGSKPVAISMTIMSKRCRKGTVVNFQKARHLRRDTAEHDAFMHDSPRLYTGPSPLSHDEALRRQQ